MWRSFGIRVKSEKGRFVNASLIGPPCFFGISDEAFELIQSCISCGKCLMFIACHCS